MSWKQVAMLILAFNFNVVMIADGANQLQQTEVENAEFGEVSEEIKIIWNRSIVTSPIIASPPLHIIIDASMSTGGNLKFAWDFGDGSVAKGSYVEHTYGYAGEYTLKLVVSNDVDSKVIDLNIQINDEPDITIIPIPFVFGDNWIPKGNILSNYEYIFASQDKQVIHIQQLYDKQDYMVSIFDKGKMIAQDILLPNHIQKFEFTVENSIRASLFDRLKLNYEHLILFQYSREELIRFYEEIYERLDDSPEFEVIADELKQGELTLDSLECVSKINNLYANEIVPIAKRYYAALNAHAETVMAQSRMGQVEEVVRVVETLVFEPSMEQVVTSDGIIIKLFEDVELPVAARIDIRKLRADELPDDALRALEDVRLVDGDTYEIGTPLLLYDVSVEIAEKYRKWGDKFYMYVPVDSPIFQGWQYIHTKQFRYMMPHKYSECPSWGMTNCPAWVFNSALDSERNRESPLTLGVFSTKAPQHISGIFGFRYDDSMLGSSH